MSNESPEPGQVRVPGVRYRKEKRTRHVEVTVRGRTRVVPQEYTVLVPAPPRDLDRVWLRVVIGGAVLFTAIAVAWSTASIGDLLSLLTTPVIAYFAASAFESVWVLCLIVEWVMRRQPDRARVAQVIGWAGLVVVVAAVVAHGFNMNQVAAGIVGGFVSVVAKALWWVVFRIFHVQLSDLGVAYLQQAREDLAVAGVLVEESQRLNATQAYYDAVYGPGTAMDALAGMRNVEATAPGVPAPSPAVPAVPPSSSPVSLPPVQAPPAAPAPAPAVPLVSPQVTPPVAAPVPPVSAPAGDTVAHAGGTPSPWAPARGDTSRERVLKGFGLPLEQPGGTPAPAGPAAPAAPVRHLPAAGGQQSKTGFIRDALAANPAITLDELTDRVRAEFGDKRDLRKDVSRLRRRITKEAS
ncbi:hypothetical protein AB0N20_27505 [Streptomyces griseoincarnatus]